MRWFSRVVRSISSLLRLGEETKRLTRELQFHVDEQARENVAAGMSVEEARRAALREFGNPGLVRDEARATWSWGWLEALGRDLRYGMRTLVRAPGFAVVSVVVLALGIGATTSLFTIVRSVLLKPLPFRDPSKLVMVYEHFRQGSVGDGFNMVSPADYLAWRQQTHGFEDMAAQRGYGFNLTGEHSELPEVVEAAAASSNLFPLLGIEPALGRNFTAKEDRPEGNHVVLLTWSLYQRRFSGNPGILGRQIHLDAQPYTVIGVLPRNFTYPDTRYQLWVPYAQTFTPEGYAKHDMHQSLVVARLRADVSLASALQQVSALQYQLHLANGSRPVAEDALSRPVLDAFTDKVRSPLIVLFCAVGCMLLIACLNVSNLLVARAASRRKEVAVRGALGGSRLVLIREQMTESLLISMAGGILGLLLSVSATHWLALHWRDLPRAESIHVDVPVLAFSFGVVLLCALLAGLVPAISSTGRGVLSALQESARSVGGGTARASLRKIMLIAEIALTVILLVSAGLLFKSFLHLRSTELGCLTDHVLTLKYGLPETQYDTREKVVAFHESLLERVRHLPGVRGAALISTVPGDGWEGDEIFTISEHPLPSYALQNDALERTVDPAYFSTMEVPVVRGRVFTEHERLTNDHEILINQKLATEYFPNEDPIDKHINIAWTGKRESYRVIGVVRDTLYSVTEPVKAMVYHPILSGIPQETGSATLVVRTAPDPLSQAVSIQQQLAALDPTIPTYDVFTMEQVLGRTTASQSFSATLLLAFAGLSLLLAGVGLYGVLSYLVTQRVAEIGIRIALGAQRSEVLRLVLWDGMKPVALGLVLGLAGGAAAGAMIRSMLYGTSSFDPLVLAGMVGTLLVTSLAACAVPAFRASRINPTDALRTQ